LNVKLIMINGNRVRNFAFIFISIKLVFYIHTVLMEWIYSFREKTTMPLLPILSVPFICPQNVHKHQHDFLFHLIYAFSISFSPSTPLSPLYPLYPLLSHMNYALFYILLLFMFFTFSTLSHFGSATFQSFSIYHLLVCTISKNC